MSKWNKMTKWNKRLTYHISTYREVSKIKVHHHWEGSIYYSMFDACGNTMDDIGKKVNVYNNCKEWSVEFYPPMIGVASIEIYEGLPEK